jgi:hypothetical protein
MTRFLLALVVGVAVGNLALAQEKAGSKTADPPANLVPLNKQETILLDAANKKVVLKTSVSLQEGLLEMFLCRKNTKEHESILTLDGRAYVVHTGLLAIGAEPGHPMLYEEGKYTPPAGQKLKITVKWLDKDNKPQEMEAKKWVRTATRRYFAETLEMLPQGVVIPEDGELRYDKKFKELAWFGTMSKPQRDNLLKMSDDKAYQKAINSIYDRSQPREMTADWVFTGSGFYVETEGPDKGKKYYKAEGGEVICVANFPSAMIDVDVESTSSGESNLLYEAWTERIPPIDTPVTVEITPIESKVPMKK